MEVKMTYRQCCLLALAAALPVLAQTSADQGVDRILEKYGQALGGRAAYEKVATRTMKGTVEIPDDNVTGTALIVARAPRSFRLTMDIPGYGLVETVLDDFNGWESNPDSGTHAMSKADLDAALRDHHFYREVRLKVLYAKMQTAGADKVEGHDVYVVEATPAAGPAEKLYFDAGTGLLVKRDYERVTLEDGIVQYEVLLRDYRDVDGLKLPFTIEQRAPDNTMIFKFTEIKNNATLADAAFAKPQK
jgi:outer membrane lipoprotein-sorting protein